MTARYPMQFAYVVNNDVGIHYTPASDTLVGAIIRQGMLVGVTKAAIEANKLDAIFKDGIWKAEKENTTDTFTAGIIVYWDETNNRATPNPIGKPLGISVLAAAATDDVVYMELFRDPCVTPRIALSQTVDRDNFTDNGDATGYIDLPTDLPKGAHLYVHEHKVLTGYIGDTTAVYQLGVDGDLDRFSIVTTGSVFADGDIRVCQPAGNGYCDADTTMRLTVTGGSDFGAITAGRSQITAFYEMIASSPVPAAS